MGKVFDPKSDVPRIIKRRFQAIKLPKPILDGCREDILKWYGCNGPAFTADRLKFIKQVVLNYAANPDGYKLPTGSDIPWVKRRNKTFLSGQWGALQRYAAKGPKTMKEVGKVIQAYTCITKQVELSDILKWKETVEKPLDSDLSVYLDKIASVAPVIKQHITHNFDGKDGLLTDITYRDDVYAFTKEYKDHHELRYQEQLFYTFSNALTDEVWKDHMNVVWPFLISTPENEELSVKLSTSRLQGFINPVIEPGYKIRFTLDHLKPMEFIMEPLGKRVYRWIEYLPWDSTFHEGYGYQLIQNALSRGQRCYCFDLPGATDRFPFDLQLKILEAMDLGPVWSDLVTLASKLYRLPASTMNIKDIGEEIQASWKVGQPMGAYPSFAIFSFTHGAILLALCGGEYKGQFVVHGDDVTIMDDKLAQAYKEFLTDCGMEPNPLKTLVSDRFAEFNSKLIYPHKVVSLRKWRPIHKNNVLDHVEYWGVKALDWAYSSELANKHKRPRALKEIEDIKSKILTIPGILPNGNSINPEGKSVDERLERVPDDFFCKKKDAVVSYGIPEELIDRRLAGANPLDIYNAKLVKRASEQEAVDTVTKSTGLAYDLSKLSIRLALNLLERQTEYLRENFMPKFSMSGLPKAKRNLVRYRPTQNCRIDNLLKLLG